MFPVVNVYISFSPLDQQLLIFFSFDHVTEITCHLFKMVQFDFEEVNFESGFGIELLLSFAVAAIGKNQPLLLKSINLDRCEL